MATKTVTTAGVAEALAGSTATKKVVVQAMKTNTGKIYVGDATNQYHEMYPLWAITLTVNNLNKVYVDSDVNGEGVNYLFEV